MSKIYVTILLLSVYILAWCVEDSNDFLQDDVAKDTQIILALWDSLTSGYWVEDSENYPVKLQQVLDSSWYNYTVINAWVSWDTSAQALGRVTQYDDPDIVILAIGWNDGLQNKSLSDMKENIKWIINYYWDQWVKVVLWWIEVPPFYGFSYSREFKNVYFEISKELKWSVYFYESFLKDVWWVLKYNQSDKVHPTAEGYDIIVENLFEYFKNEKIITK